ARALLAERKGTGKAIDGNAKAKIVAMAVLHNDPVQRLVGLWTANAIGAFNDDLIKRTLIDNDPFVRAWTIQLALDNGHASPAVLTPLADMALSDPSQIVRLYLASAIQRVDEPTAWK